ncbi:MAG: phosphate-starvation-inducible PsiE family protein [Thermomicrobiales bacterium]
MHDEGVPTTEDGGASPDEPSVHGEHGHHAAQLRRTVTPWLNGADTFVYVLVGIVFLAGALVMLGYSVVTFFQNLGGNATGGFPQAVITLVNDLLLVMIIMEVLRTVLSYIEEGGASLRPFLFIGAISATRRILAIGAETSLAGSKPVSREDFVRRLVDLGVNALVVLLIVIALYLLSRREPS